eukprot:gene10953-12114_t
MANNNSGYVFPPPLASVSGLQANARPQTSMESSAGSVFPCNNNNRPYFPSNNPWVNYARNDTPRSAYNGTQMYASRSSYGMANGKRFSSNYSSSYTPNLQQGFSTYGSSGAPPPRRNKCNYSKQFKMTPGKKLNQNNSESKELLYCDPCERQFKSLTDKESHLKSHAQCEVGGCTFVASRKMLQLHFIQTHETGRFKINLQTNEEIEQWREERRRNYPTASKALAKEKAREEKWKSGSILKTKEFSYRGRGTWNKKYEDRNRNTRRREMDMVDDNFHHADEKKWMPDKDSTNCQIVKNNNHISPQKEIKNSINEELQQTNALMNLTVYESSEDSQDEYSSELSLEPSTCAKRGLASELKEKIGGNIGSKGVDTVEMMGSIQCDGNVKEAVMEADKEDSPGDLRLGEANLDEGQYTETPGNLARCFNTTGNSMRNRKEVSTKKCGGENWQQNDRKRKRDNNFVQNNNPLKQKRKCKPTLLEMLLAKDIRHERNVILQCIRYIVKKNFFMDTKSIAK